LRKPFIDGGNDTLGGATMRPVLIAFVILTVTAGRSAAQSSKIVTAEMLVELPARTATSSAGSDKVTLKGFGVGAGFPIGKASLEFAGLWHSAEIDIDRDIGATAITEARVVNRDIPFVAAIRFRPSCPDRWCAEIDGGAGINFSRRTITTIGDCGSASQPLSTCRAITGTATVVNKEEPTVFVGTAVTMRVGDRLDIGPSFRLWYVGRYRDKTVGHAAVLSNQRTPSNGRIELGATVVWHLK
jgi:hypothetical protein